MQRVEMAELILKQADEGQYFEVNRDEVIQIRLPENPTTGYQWTIDEINETVLELEDSDFVLPSNANIGGSGERIFRFRAKSIGTSHVLLKMQREWEVDVPPIDRYDVTLQIE
jgi:predicted secreted protein